MKRKCHDMKFEKMNEGTLYFGDPWSHARPRLFSPVNSHGPSCDSSLQLPHANCFCSLKICAWLTWWCRHDGETASGHSQGTTKTSTRAAVMCLPGANWLPAAISQTRSVAASLLLSCAQPCQCVLSQQGRSVAPNRPTFFVQRWRWGRFRAMLWFFMRFFL